MISNPPGAITLKPQTESSRGSESMLRAVWRTVTRGEEGSIKMPRDFKIRPPASWAESITTSPVSGFWRCSTGWLSR